MRQPAPQSWLDRFLRAIEGWPIHPGITYASLAVLGAAIVQGSVWACAPLDVRTLSTQAMVTGAWTFFSLAALHLSFAVARDALANFRPALPPGDEVYTGALHRLAMAPTWATILAGAFGIAWLIAMRRVDPSFFGMVGAPACSDPVVLGFGWLNSSAILLNILLAGRDLAAVHQLHQAAPHINIFDRRPLFAFSRLTSAISVMTIVLTYVFYLSFPTVTRNPVVYIFILIINFPLALAAFLLPLYGMHRRISTEKGRRLTDISLRLQATAHTIHQRMETGNLKGVEQINTLFASLLNEERYVRTIPTWPWEPGTLTGLLTALFLPLGIFAAQRLIEQFLLS